MKIMLLGGSNSVLKYGLQAGLGEYFEIDNLALGATSCIQNLTELVKNKDKLINLSEILIEKEILDAEEVESILETGSLPKVGNDSKEDVEVKQESDT